MHLLAWCIHSFIHPVNNQQIQQTLCLVLGTQSYWEVMQSTRPDILKETNRTKFPEGKPIFSCESYLTLWMLISICLEGFQNTSDLKMFWRLICVCSSDTMFVSLNIEQFKIILCQLFVSPYYFLVNPIAKRPHALKQDHLKSPFLVHCIFDYEAHKA